MEGILPAAVAPLIDEGMAPVDAVAHAAHFAGRFDDDQIATDGRLSGGPGLMGAAASGDPAHGLIDDPGLSRFPAVNGDDVGGAHFVGGPEVEGIKEPAIGEGEAVDLRLAEEEGDGAGGGEVLPGDFLIFEEVRAEGGVRIGDDADGSIGREGVVKGVDALFEGVSFEHAVAESAGQAPADGLAH